MSRRDPGNRPEPYIATQCAPGPDRFLTSVAFFGTAEACSITPNTDQAVSVGQRLQLNSPGGPRLSCQPIDFVDTCCISVVSFDAILFTHLSVSIEAAGLGSYLPSRFTDTSECPYSVVALTLSSTWSWLQVLCRCSCPKTGLPDCLALQYGFCFFK